MNLSDIFVAGAGATVTVLDDQTFNSSGTWTKPVGITYAPTDMALIELWGGGGGGTAGGGSGGGAGAYLRVALPLSSLGTTQSVSVGAGGAGNTLYADVATRGGDTTFAGVVAQGGVRGSATPDPLMNGYYPATQRLYSAGAGGPGLLPGVKSVYGGSGGDGVASGTPNNGAQPGGGGGGNVGPPASNRGGSGGTGRVRVRILRGLNNFEIAEGPL